MTNNTNSVLHNTNFPLINNTNPVPHNTNLVTYNTNLPNKWYKKLISPKKIIKRINTHPNKTDKNLF